MRKTWYLLPFLYFLYIFFLLRYNMYRLMTFYICIYPWNHYSGQGMEHCQHVGGFPTGNHCSDIYHPRLILPLIKLYIIWIIQYIYTFMSGFFHSISCLWDSFIFLPVSAVLFYCCMVYITMQINQNLFINFLSMAFELFSILPEVKKALMNTPVHVFCWTGTLILFLLGIYLDEELMCLRAAYV